MCIRDSLLEEYVSMSIPRTVQGSCFLICGSVNHMSRECIGPRTSEGPKPKVVAKPGNRQPEEQERYPAKTNRPKGTPTGAKGRGGDK
eukprot:5453102-Prorocentrum_lima.AAC.1